MEVNMKLAMIAFFFSTFTLAQSQPQIVMAPLDHLYVPQGFDSNDSAEIVVTGRFPNACFSRNAIEVKVVNDLIDIKITAIAPDTSTAASRVCPKMLVPFKEVVTLGNLQGGEYKIRINSETKSSLKDNLTIAEASSSAIDDHIYSAVEWIEKVNENEYVLHGWRYSDCLDFEKIQIVSNNKDTLSILPVMKQLSDFCPMKMMPTSYPFKVDFSTLKVGQPLLHVRTMDGKSVNSVVNLVE
jgi:hypothetical protein